MEKELFDDLIAACNEAAEHERGNIKLKSNVVTIPDDEINFHYVYGRLSEMNKQKTMNYMNELLYT